MLTEQQLEALGLSVSVYESLSTEEKSVIDNLVEELKQGNSDALMKNLEDLYYADYDEIPVDFISFLKDDNYLGKSTRNGSSIFPFWQKEGMSIFSRSDINEVAVTGSIGTGKTTAAALFVAYHLYRTMCMRDPQKFFGLTPGSEITYAFLNNTLSSSYGVGYKTVQAFLQESPWFLKHGKIVGRNQDEYLPEKGFGFVVGSKPQHTLGKHVICALIDEVSFAPGQNVNYEQSKIMGVYANIKRRMESRFMVQGHMYGLMLLVSSKATESSFLEAYIADQVRKGYPIYVIDQPLWNVKPAAYSGKKFQVAVGNKFLPSHIIDANTKEEQEKQCEAYKKQGLRIIDVPIEHKQAFDQDIDKALQDIAGISTSVVTKSFSMVRIEKCIQKGLMNPFTTEVVTIGLHDNLELEEFFRADLVPDIVRSAPMFLHLDASVKGDRTGLSGVAIIGSKNVVSYGPDVGSQEVSEELIYQHVFTVGIQAPSDSEISFEKTRRFIYYLKYTLGFNIKVISSDGFQSVDFRQILSTKGFDTKYTSLDRTPDGYDSLKSAINDERIILLEGCKVLYNELTELEKDNFTYKYDHPITGSKDLSDSLAGALFDALQYKDEFLFWNPSQYDYKGINQPQTPEEEFIEDFKTSLLGDKEVSISDYPSYNDDGILSW